MDIQYLGHSAFLITVSTGEKLLFDPFITPNELAKGKIALKDLTPNFIFLSHAHFDHIADAEELSKSNNAPIIGVWEIHSYFQERGCPTHPMNVGGTWKSSKGNVSVKLVPAIHTSSFPDGRYGGVPVGFVISDERYTVYYSGDTALSIEMELIAERYTLDAAILPIGGTFTMDVDDAIEAALLVDVEHVIGMHYDTFPPIQIDHRQAQEKFRENDCTLHLLEIGQTISIKDLVSTSALRS
ncbi:MAG: metal-dependent hydrolase [Bacteroidia bacterium]|nr:metal-dependent hydrolase [Bacteroidia bacterium]MCX7764491.1 metal-dependent hydrolase [Bacteroidia bacterium]MDW8058338.1 metal-dependent hydrolase [Bacteroidia bacterium]